MRGCSLAPIAVLPVVWISNPLMPVASRQVRHVTLTGTDTVDSIMRRMGLRCTPVLAVLNSSVVARRRWGKRRVREGDSLVLTQQMRGTGAEEKLAFETLASFFEAVGSAALTFVTSDFAIALGLSLLANALSRTDSPNGGSDQEKTPDVYSVSGGANEARNYGPLPLVLGEHRVFPDYASRPFSEFVPDTETVVINSTPRYEDQTPPDFGFTGPDVDAPWTSIAMPDEFTTIYGDNQARSFPGPSGTYAQPHTFVIKDVTGGGSTQVTTYEEYLQGVGETGPYNWRDLGGSYPVIIGYGYTYTTNTERLTSIFNFGFGDLEVTDLRIGTNELTQYNSYQLDVSRAPTGVMAVDRTVLTGYTTEGRTGDAYPGSVEEVDGGRLVQNDSVPDSGWIERQGSQGCKFIQLDIAGRLFHQGDGGLENLSCVIEAEYQAPDSSWVAFGFSPLTLTNGSTTPVRNTYAVALDVDVTKVRVRRTTPDATDARDVSDIELTRIKYFRNTDALYPAQTRRGLLIKATGQLNGRIDRLSAFVRAKHWVWGSAEPWTPGEYPDDDSAPWAWQHTTNPAWLFLYYARGGFLNKTANKAYLGGMMGWLDRPDTMNGQRLFGCGLTNDRIDYASIIAWGQYCLAAGLECRMEVFSDRSAGNVLDDIAGAGRASKTWSTGRLGVVWEAAGQPVVAAFGMSNIYAGSFGISYDTDTSVDEFALDYTRTDNEYQADTVYAAVPGVAQIAQQRSERAAFSMPRSLAQRLVNLRAASKHYHHRAITWESGEEALRVQRGDVVHLAHDLTMWAYSGRLASLTVTAGQVTTVELAAAVEDPRDSETYYLWVRLPSGSFLSVACTPPEGRTRTLQVVGAWPVANAPGYLGAGLDAVNDDSTWPDSVPEDFTYFAGPTATPGKRVRIMAMEPLSQRRVRITARDEDESYYPLEFSLVDPPAAVETEQRIARAYNLAAEPIDAGGLRLSWELEASTGAEVMVSVNGGEPAQAPVSGFLTVSGTELLLPPYAPGTVLAIQLLPIAAGTPVAVQGDAIDLIV